MKKGYMIDYTFYKNNSKQVSMGIDYLRLSYGHRLDISDSLGIDIDDDNSNFSIIKILDYDITIEKSSIKGLGFGYFATISYNGQSVPIFVVKYWKSRTIVDFYGSLFRLIDLGYFPSDFINTIRLHLCLPDNVSISRIDYRIDYFLDENINVITPYQLLKHNVSNSQLKEWKKGHNLTNWQCGDKDSKSVVFRLYDKLLDSRKKHKDFLYVDYFRFSSVHRLEFECNLKFCKGFTFITLDKLLDKINSVFGLNNQPRLGKILYRYDKNKLVYTRNEIALYHSGIYKDVSFLVSNYINSNYQLNLNPLDILFGYISKFNGDNITLSKNIGQEFMDTRHTLLKSKSLS